MMQPKHNRKLVVSGVDCIGTDLNNNFKAWKICDEIEQLMIDSGYLEGAPFMWVSLIFLYSIGHSRKVLNRRINKTHGDLGLSLPLDMRVLTYADQKDFALLREIFEIATLDCLIHAGKKYKLQTAALEERRAQLGNIPEWSEIKNKPDAQDLVFAKPYYQFIERHGEEPVYK